MKSDFKFGYIKDLTTNQKYPICGVRRTNYPERRFTHVSMFAPVWAQLRQRDYQQPFEVYWNYNEVREDMNRKGHYVNKPFHILPDSLGIVHKSIILNSVGLTETWIGEKRVYVIPGTELNNFEVFGQATLARYRAQRIKNEL